MSELATRQSQTLPEPGDVVSFDDGRGNTLTGFVKRVWGRHTTNVTIRTDEDQPRTFVRLLTDIQPGARA